jgi:hypothetical protein
MPSLQLGCARAIARISVVNDGWYCAVYLPAATIGGIAIEWLYTGDWTDRSPNVQLGNQCVRFSHILFEKSLFQDWFCTHNTFWRR